MNWKRTDDELPDADLVVLVHNPRWDDEPIWLGVWDDESETWDDLSCLPFAIAPTHWAELPEVPSEVEA